MWEDQRGTHRVSVCVHHTMVVAVDGEAGTADGDELDTEREDQIEDEPRARQAQTVWNLKIHTAIKTEQTIGVKLQTQTGSGREVWEGRTDCSESARFLFFFPSC